MQAEKWWLNHLNSEGFVLNPALCAMEGSSRRFPSFAEFCTTLSTTRAVLARELPKAKVLDHGEGNLHALYAIIEQLIPRREREISFLRSVAPLLANRVARRAASSLEERILDEGQASGLLTRSLVVLCALSCLYERPDGLEPMIGRGVLKPRGAYGESDAYNAVADLQCLEFLAYASALGDRLGLVTRDKYLTAFWCALDIKSPEFTDGGSSLTASPSPELFPGLTDEEFVALFDRMARRVAS